MPDSPTFNVVLFDMDETLVQHRATGIELVQRVYNEYQDHLPNCDLATFGQTVRAKANDMWNMMFDGVLSGDVARPYIFRNTLRALEADESIAEAMMETFEQAMLAETDLMDGAAEVLEALNKAGIKTAVVTNGFTDLQLRKARHHGLEDRTQFVLPSEAAGYHKPDPRIFHVALERIGGNAETALFVGDNVRADIQGARTAGLRAALFDPEGVRIQALEDAPAEHQPTHVFAHLSEILQLPELAAARN